MRRLVTLVLTLLGLVAPPAMAADRTAVPASLFGGMSWREIGPYRGGRIAAVAGVPNQPDTYYLGAAIGGVWRTTDGGHAWEPIFDHEAVGSIGAIAIAPSDPNTIYVGTGETAPREDVSFGNGMYKSTDAGKSWTHIGLDDSQHIARIIIDAADPKIALVAALGHVYGPNSERGVFRTTDGGTTWKKVLFRDDKTGAIELAADPDNPRTIFAALWQMDRTPWSLSSGGPGSGLYKSVDGGVTWSPVTGGGFAHGTIGKIGVSVAAGTHGQRVYAIVEATDGGLYRSDDGGTTWRLANDDHRLWSRAWYFTKIWSHPKNPDVVFVAGGSFWKSADGAKTFERVKIPGADHHDLWINPSYPDHMIEGFDQGIVISVNGGLTWDKRNNLPIGQFYHVSTDRAFPYSVYAAQQDIGAIAIASRGWGGVTGRDWFSVGGDDAECGFVWPDPLHDNLVIAGGYAGALTVFDKNSHQLRDIAPWSNANGGHPVSDTKYRFTWTSPVVFSPQEPQLLLYMGSQYVMATRNGGASWSVISPDLTRNDKSKQGNSGGPITKDNASVEYYDVIFSIAPSPLRAGQIWIGTDDGLVQLTTDGGATWTNVTPPGMPEWAKVSMIEASPLDANTAYVAVDAHKLDDFEPYIFRTHDNGRSWTRITNGLRKPAHVYAVREDPKRQGLLFAGTETGAFVSFDDGDNWQPLQLNLPTTSVRDLTVHDDDLIVATHGRSIWILDAIEPLREASEAIAREPLHLFTPRAALRVHEADTYTVPVEPAGANPPDAILDYYLASPAKDISLTIVDGGGSTAFAATAAKDKLPATPGMHRVTWNLRYPLPPLIPTAVYNERPPRGIMAVPGAYTVKLTADGKSVTAPLTVKLDPRVNVTGEALAAEFSLARRLMEMSGEVHAAANGIMDVRRQLAAVQPKLSAGDAELLSSIDREADDILNKIYEPKAKAGVDLLNYPMQLNVRIAYLEDEVDFGDGAPTAQFEEMAREYGRDVDTQLARWQKLRSTKLAQLNARLEAQRLAPVTCCPPIVPKSGDDSGEGDDK